MRHSTLALFNSGRLIPMKTFCVRGILCLFLVALVLPLSGCRRNLMRISTNPDGAQVYVQGKVVRLEDSDRPLARKIDEKKKRESPLNEEEEVFEKDRKRHQLTPVEYEFSSVACGYSIYCLKPGFHPFYHIEYIKPRWYEYPPIDLFVDLLPVTVTDEREVIIDMEPVENQAARP